LKRSILPKELRKKAAILYEKLQMAGIQNVLKIKKKRNSSH